MAHGTPHTQLSMRKHVAQRRRTRATAHRAPPAGREGCSAGAARQTARLQHSAHEPKRARALALRLTPRRPGGARAEAGVAPSRPGRGRPCASSCRLLGQARFFSYTVEAALITFKEIRPKLMESRDSVTNALQLAALGLAGAHTRAIWQAPARPTALEFARKICTIDLDLRCGKKSLGGIRRRAEVRRVARASLTKHPGACARSRASIPCTDSFLCWHYR